jgi:transposase
MTDPHDELNLASTTIGPLPLINHFIDRIGLAQLLERYVPSPPSLKLSQGQAILLLVRNILIERNPLYRLSEWAAVYEPSLIGLGAARPSVLNDDRVGRSLDALFLCDRASLLTSVVLKSIQEFAIELSELHNDSTTVTVSGQYQAPRSYKGKTAVLLTPGWNKDYRPDLKQLLFSLTVSRDGAVPIHYKCFDGNTTDDKTHIQVWENLRGITGRSDFIYVADSKLCTREQMGYLAREGGKFICVLPQTRKECAWFRSWVQGHQVEWQEILRRPDHRRPHSGAAHVYWGFPSPLPSEEGFRVLWILSSQKQKQDAQRRQEKIHKTIDALAKLKLKVGKGRLKTKDQIHAAVEGVVATYGSGNWFDWKVTVQERSFYRQKGKGRPGKGTEYIRSVQQSWSFEAMPHDEKIQQEATFDGMFPLITNISEEELPMREVLLKYKYQPYIEKRHEQFKSVLEAAPVFLKLPHRVEALMFIYFMALLLNALIERELRRAMDKNAIHSLPLYPEERKCRFPTTARIVTLFSNHRRSSLFEAGKIVKTFFDPLTETQQTVLKLLGVATGPFGS